MRPTFRHCNGLLDTAHKSGEQYGLEQENCRHEERDIFWGQDWISFYKSLSEDAPGRKVWQRWRSKNPEAAEKAFLAIIARQLYSKAHALIRKYDSNHLIFGDRYLESDMPDHEVREALPYIDAIAIQPTKRTFDAESFAGITKRYGRPIYISDHVSSYKTSDFGDTAETLNLVVVHDGHQVVKPVLGCEQDGLPVRTLIQLAIAKHNENAP